MTSAGGSRSIARRAGSLLTSAGSERLVAVGRSVMRRILPSSSTAVHGGRPWCRAMGSACSSLSPASSATQRATRRKHGRCCRTASSSGGLGGGRWFADACAASLRHASWARYLSRGFGVLSISWWAGSCAGSLTSLWYSPATSCFARRLRGGRSASARRASLRVSFMQPVMSLAHLFCSVSRRSLTAGAAWVA